jgi:hypothetical protein
MNIRVEEIKSLHPLIKTNSGASFFILQINETLTIFSRKSVTEIVHSDLSTTDFTTLTYNRGILIKANAPGPT